jgi:flagellar P-ring protein precursor FlgI
VPRGLQFTLKCPHTGLKQVRGRRSAVAKETVTARDERAKNVILGKGATVEELVRALTTVGSTPRDIISILQNLRAAGALDAELEVI